MSRLSLLDKIHKFLQDEYSLRQEIREAVSLILMDSDEDHPLAVDITLDCYESMGLSTLELPHISRCWQEPEGWIYLDIDYKGCPTEFDSFSTQELVQIYEGLIAK